LDGRRIVNAFGDRGDHRGGEPLAQPPLAVAVLARPPVLDLWVAQEIHRSAIAFARGGRTGVLLIPTPAAVSTLLTLWIFAQTFDRPGSVDWEQWLPLQADEPGKLRFSTTQPVTDLAGAIADGAAATLAEFGEAGYQEKWLERCASFCSFRVWRHGSTAVVSEALARSMDTCCWLPIYGCTLLGT